MAYTPNVSYDLYGPKNAPTDSAAKDYMSHNLDVWNAFNADPNATDANSFALQHYNNFGKGEYRTWGTPAPPPTIMGGTPTGGTLTSPFATLSNSLNSIAGNIQNDTTSKSILAELLAAIRAQNGNIDKGVQAAVDANNSTLRTGINDTAKSTLQSLVNRRMMTGDVASDTMGSALGEVTRKAGAVNALATLEGMNKKAEIPKLYSDALTVEANSSASHIDSLMKPYQLLLNLLETDIYKYAE